VTGTDICRGYLTVSRSFDTASMRTFSRKGSDFPDDYLYYQCGHNPSPVPIPSVEEEKSS